MKRPLIWMFLIYVLGIIGGWYCLTLSGTTLFFIFSILLFLCLYKKYRWNGILIFPLILLLGYFRIGQSFEVEDPLLESLVQKNEINKNTKLVGIVEDISYLNEDKISCIIESQEIGFEDKKFKTPTKVKVYINNKAKVNYGDLVCIKGQIRLFDQKRNPGGWDEAFYMKTRRIDYKMFGDLIYRQSHIKTPKSSIYELRDQWSKIYDELLPTNQASLIKAMILGERNGLSQEQKEIYQEAGISHILAISGLHISIIALFLWRIFKILKVSDYINTFCVLSFLWLYCLLTGLGVSTVRAVLIITIILFGKVLHRSHDMYTSLALAALIILINQPLYLWDAGFQLSFMAVLGLIFLGPFLDRVFWIPKIIRKLLIPSISVGLATLPIVSYHFYYISIVGFILNLFIVPLAAFVVGIGFIGGLMGFIWIAGARFVIGMVYYILCFYETMSKMFVSIPYSHIITGGPSVFSIILYYITALIVCLSYIYTKKININKKIKYCFLIVLILLWSTVLVKDNSFEIVFLDVGQGDAIAIHTKNGKNLLIDGGEKDPTRVLVPYFRYKGISSIDAVFLTHPDKDHILGLIGILEYIHIKNIFVSVEDDGQDEIYHQFIARAKELGITCYFLKQGDQISYGDVNLYCLYPENNKKKYKSQGWNEVSMVLRISYGKSSFLLTGDVEKEGENSILNLYKPIRTDFIKVPHHGSKTSSCEAFVSWCNPKTAIISCGKNNRYGHPHEEVLKRYLCNNTRILSTDEMGAIRVSSDGKDYVVNTMMENRGNEYEEVKRATQKKYFSFGLLILWGGAIFKKIVFRGNTEETGSF